MKTDDALTLSLVSLDEIRYRMDAGVDAVTVWHFLGHGLEETHPDYPLDETIEFKMRTIASSYAFIQIASIFDSNGKYSLRISHRKTKISVSKARLRKLFPALLDSQIDAIQNELNLLLTHHKKTINTILDVRHTRIAHASAEIRKYRITEDDSYFSHTSTLPRSFRFKRIYEIYRDLKEILHTID